MSAKYRIVKNKLIVSILILILVLQTTGPFTIRPASANGVDPTSGFIWQPTYTNTLPGLPDSFFVDPAQNAGRRGLNKRIVESDFEPGRIVTFGGNDPAYEGDNIPIVGDFNSDGFDDIGVKWGSGENANRWTISLNDQQGNFLPGQIVTFGGSDPAYEGDNIPIVGDFNSDGFDDIGVKWGSGENANRWTISLNDQQGNFLPGQIVTFGGSDPAYEGDNIPIAGDFNGDGYDDIGVKWVSGEFADYWTVSLNDQQGNFLSGQGITFGGDNPAYVGDNIPIVGDFNGDAYDDIGVKWVSGENANRWTISTNDLNGNFNPGRIVSFGGSDPAYIGDNIPIVGDFNADGYDDIGVKWVSGENANRWTISLNHRKGLFDNGKGVTIRVPVVFINFSDQPEISDHDAKELIAKTKQFWEKSSYGNLIFDLRYKVVNLSNPSDWTGGVPQPRYDWDGILTNGDAFPSVENYAGYFCRFRFPTNFPIFGDFNGDGYDDIGVKWVRGVNANRWTISTNDLNGNFNAGSVVSFGGSDPAYVGGNIPIVGDFNGDGYDDIGVKWVSGEFANRWAISTNDLNGNFNPGRIVSFGGSDPAYEGDNIPIVGDFNGDGYDDIGVKWVSGEFANRWAISTNDLNGNFNPGSVVSFGGSDPAYVGGNIPIVGDFNGDGYDDIGVQMGQWRVRKSLGNFHQ